MAFREIRISLASYADALSSGKRHNELKERLRRRLQLGFHTLFCSSRCFNNFLTTMYGAAIPPTLAHIDEKPTPMVLYKKRKGN